MSITNAFRIALRKASELVYDPTASGLTATDVQAAIDELAAGAGGNGAPGRIVVYEFVEG